MPKRWNLWAFFAIFLPSGMVLGIHAYLGSFNRFIADDFCSAYFAERLGFVRSIWFWYLTWFGTYASSMADSILPLIGPRGISLAVPVVLVIWTAASVLAVVSLWPKETPKTEKVFSAVSLGTAVVYVTLLISPNVPQSLYWWGGMRAYISPLLLATFYVTIFQRFASKNRPTKVFFLWYGLSFLFSFFTGGFSETFTPVQVIFFIFIIGLRLVIQKQSYRSPASIFLFMGLLGVMVALTTMIAAPGNTQRQGFFPKSPDLLTILSISLTGYFAFLRDVVSSPEKIAGLTGLTLAALWLGMQTKSNRNIKGWTIPAILLAGFVFAFGCFPSAAYGLSDVPPTRTLVIPAYFLVIGLTIAGFALGQWLMPWVRTRVEIPINLGLCSIVLATMLFSAWMNGQSLYSNRQKYIDYAQQWDQMNAQILHAKAARQESVTIPAIKNWAGLDAPNDNPKFWVNYCLSKYYDISVLAQSTDQ